MTDRTLCSEAGLYITFLQFGICAHFVIEIHSFTSKKPDSQANSRGTVRQAKSKPNNGTSYTADHKQL
jgi:hypothetical protein